MTREPDARGLLVLAHTWGGSRFDGEGVVRQVAERFASWWRDMGTAICPEAPAKLYVASFGDGVKHVHSWVLPRPEGMRPGLHWVLAQMDQRAFATRRLGIKPGHLERVASQTLQWLADLERAFDDGHRDSSNSAA